MCSASCVHWMSVCPLMRLHFADAQSRWHRIRASDASADSSFKMLVDASLRGRPTSAHVYCSFPCVRFHCGDSGTVCTLVIAACALAFILMREFVRWPSHGVHCGALIKTSHPDVDWKLQDRLFCPTSSSPRCPHLHLHPNGNGVAYYKYELNSRFA